VTYDFFFISGGVADLDDFGVSGKPLSKEIERLNKNMEKIKIGSK
jgi:hypothetical protein